MEIRTVKVNMWGTTIGYLHRQDNGLIGFQYDEKFIASGIELAPIQMPLPIRFLHWQKRAFEGCRGCLQIHCLTNLVI